MSPRRMLAILALVASALAGCHDDPGNDRCESCSNDADCRSGLTCQQFTTPSTGNTFLACADQNPNMTCPGR